MLPVGGVGAPGVGGAHGLDIASGPIGEILLVEQQMSFIRRVADRFCLLHKGRSVAQGSVAQLDNPRLLPLIHC